MSKTLLFVSLIIAVAIGGAIEFFKPTYITVPSWIITLGLLFIILIFTLTLQQKRLNKRINNLAQNLKGLAAEQASIKDALSFVEQQISTLPETDHVASELRILRGLMKQFSAKLDQNKKKGAEEAAESGDAAQEIIEAPDSDAIDSQAKTTTTTREPFLDYDDSEILTYLEKAVREDHVQLYIQPTVRLPQRTGVFYECFSRITDDMGNVIRPEQYLPISNKAGLTAALDNLLLFRCIQLVRQTRRDRPNIAFFCNISDATLTDIDFFTDFIDFMAGNTQLAPSLVFEFSQRTVENDDFEIQTNLKRLSGLGFRLSVDQLKNLKFDLPSLSSRGFKFIKIDAHLLHEIASGSDAPVNMKSLKGAMDREAMDLIVEKIENEEMLLDLLDLKIDFGQGYLFGEPRSIQK